MNELTLVRTNSSFSFVDEGTCDPFLYALIASYEEIISYDEDIPAAFNIVDFEIDRYGDDSALHLELDIHFAWHMHAVDPENFKEPESGEEGETNGVPMETFEYLVHAYGEGIREMYIQDIEVGLKMLNMAYYDAFEKKIMNDPICEVW